MRFVLLLASILMLLGAAFPAASQSPAPGRFTGSPAGLRLPLGGSLPNRSLTRTYALDGGVEPKPTWFLQVGATYASGASGSDVLTAPTELGWISADKATRVLLDVDAYARVRASGESRQGVGDPALTVAHEFGYGRSSSLVLGGIVAVPSGSPTSSGHAAQTALLIARHEFNDDAFAGASPIRDGSIELSASATHDNEFPSEAGSSIGWTFGAFYYQGFAKLEDTDVFAGFSRDYRRNGSAESSVTVGADFVITSSVFGPFAKVLATIKGTCSVSSSGRCGLAEFYLQFPFK